MSSPPPLIVLPGTPPNGDGRPVVVLAGGRQRVAARLLDFAAISLAMMAPQALLMAVVAHADAYRMDDDLMVTMVVTSMILVLAFWLFIRVVRLVLWGCSVGHRIAGIRVVRLDDFRFPNWRQAFARFAPTWGGRGTSAIGPWSDVFACRRDERTRQCLHDRAAGTVVVQAVDGEPARRAVLAATIPLGALALGLALALLT